MHQPNHCCLPMPQVEGSAHAGGDFGYVPQNPWCQNLSLRENIVFGQPWDEAHYREVLHACALELDLEILAAGDLSKVGGWVGGWRAMFLRVSSTMESPQAGGAATCTHGWTWSIANCVHPVF